MEIKLHMYLTFAGSQWHSRPIVCETHTVHQMVNRGHIVSKFMEAKVSFELWVDSGIGLPMLH
jgi:hypothetical protein